MFEEIEKIDEGKGFVAYDCDNVYFFCGEKGAVASDHEHDYPDVVFVIKGEVELIVGTETHHVTAPKKITIPPNIYHKFTALTDVIAVETKLD
ncbi:MAG: cupin domain-containing protein [Patescibacteria group bacterium]|jgi:quercetin dioxygenase-like cupin family protein|nr:cupin domain-containing protein [Patescibacteria group bacterium]